MVLGSILHTSNILPAKGDATQFFIQAKEGPAGPVGQVAPSAPSRDHDILVSHIFGRVPTDAMLQGRTPRATGFAAVSQGLAEAANAMVGKDVLTAENAGKLVRAGKDLLLVGMKQAPDTAELEAHLKEHLGAYAAQLVDTLKPYAEWGGMAAVAAVGGREAVLNYARTAAVAVQPYLRDYGRVASYISRMLQAGNLSAASIGVIVLMQADIQRGMARAQNDLKGGGAPLSEKIGPPWAGYQVGDWVSVRYFEVTEKIDVALVVAAPAAGHVTLAKLSTSKIEVVPLKDVAFVSQDQYNILVAKEPELRGWVNMMLADQTVREAVPALEETPNLPPAKPPALSIMGIMAGSGTASVCHARRRLMGGAGWGNESDEDEPACYGGGYGERLRGGGPDSDDDPMFEPTPEERERDRERYAARPMSESDSEAGEVLSTHVVKSEYLVEFYADEDNPEMDSWEAVDFWMYNDNPDASIGAHQVEREGRVNGKVIAWLLQQNYTVDVERSIYGLQEYYKYESRDAAEEWRNRGVPSFEPFHFIVYTDPDDHTNTTTPLWRKSAGNRKPYARESREQMGPEWLRLVDEESVYKVGDTYLAAREWPADQSPVEVMFRSGPSYLPEEKQYFAQDLADATLQWQAKAIQYREHIDQESLARDREMAEFLQKQEHRGLAGGSNPQEIRQQMEIEGLGKPATGGGGAGLLIVGALAAAVIFLR